MKRLIILTLAILAFGLPAKAQQVPKTQSEITLSFSPVVKRTAPAVVNVFTRKTVQRQNPFAGDPFFERFFREFGGLGSGRKMQNSLGSGVILTADGYVVTNNHVVGGADEIRVVLNNKDEYDGDLVFADQPSDLAILRLRSAADLPGWQNQYPWTHLTGTEWPCSRQPDARTYLPRRRQSYRD